MSENDYRELLPSDKEILLQHLQHIEQLCRAIQEQVYHLEPVLHAPANSKHLLQKMVTTKELTQRLQVSPATLFKLRKKGMLPFFRIGRRIFYDMNEILRMRKEE